MLLRILLLLLCLISLPPLFAQKGRAPNNFTVTEKVLPNTKAITITGEVVDAWCYCSQVMGDGRGPEHKNCAIACAHGGVSLGIVDDKTGQLYIAAKHRAYQGCRDLLLPFVARKVTVKGWVANRGGCQVLKISSVAPASKD